MLPLSRRFAPGGQQHGQLECVVHYSGADITSNPLYRQWASQFNYQFDPTSIVDSVKTKKKSKRANNGHSPVDPAVTKEVTSVLRPLHVLVGKDNAGLQSAFLASTIYTRKLHTLFPTVFTPLSVLQRKGTLAGFILFASLLFIPLVCLYCESFLFIIYIFK
jgi:hypothetical protein